MGILPSRSVLGGARSLTALATCVAFGFALAGCLGLDEDSSETTVDIATNSNSIVAKALTDPDGNSYRSIRIGTQVWLADNYRSTKFADGSAIQEGGIPSTWQACATAKVPCHSLPHFAQNPADSNGQVYGALYNWEAVHSTKFAPAGWHVPTNAEWQTLQAFLLANGYKSGTPSPGAPDDMTAKALASRSGWEGSSYANAIGNALEKNNGSGFDAKGCGNINYTTGQYAFKSKVCGFWTATEYNVEQARFVNLSYDNASPVFSNQVKEQGYAVRFVKDP